MIFSPSLPVDAILPALAKALASHTSAVLTAEPGAGKTTRVPPALLDASWLDGKKIIMLEPRRLAARNAAEFIAASKGEKAGQSVGYRIRGESCISARTRIEVLTEGILTRMLVQEQDLPDTGLVIFDEFHERSIHADMGLALTLDLQKHLRPDLRILVMSATLDTVMIASLLKNAPVVSSSGQAHPVDVQYARTESDAWIEDRMSDAILRALRNHEGDVLAFLPGIREIRRTDERLHEKGISADVIVHLLYGDARYDQQRTALLPDPAGRRKVILSTSIAETSLTIEGITVVIDSGLARTVQFDPRRGMAGLVTVPVSQAIAEQRRGRAGRLGPGTCYRLWTEARHASLPAFPTPEIRAADLTHVALDLAAWGDPYGEELAFIDPPPRPSLDQARGLLTVLGAIGPDGSLTSHGRMLASFPLHPRYGHMIIRARELGHGTLACDIAALLEERDIFAGRRDEDIDLTARVIELGRSSRREENLRERTREQAKRYRGTAGIADEDRDTGKAGLLLGLAYPDRVARRRPGSERYQLSSGRTAILPARSVLGKHEFLAVGHVDGAGAEVRIQLAAPLSAEDIQEIFAGQVVESNDVRWDPTAGSVIARKVRAAGSLVLEERPLTDDTPEVVTAFLDGIRSTGLHTLPWDKETRSFVDRSEWVRRYVPSAGQWPDCSPDGLLASLDEWLGPFVGGMKKLGQLKRLDLKAALQSRFTHAQLRDLDRFAPTAITVPSGSKVRLSYEEHGTPVLAVKLQEMFGQLDTPRIGDGKVPVQVQLLSPAGRPLAVTQDLASFWMNTYPEIRTQLRARYPKHPWPEDPVAATPTRRTVRKPRSR